MAIKNVEPTKAKLLASLVTGNAEMYMGSATVQRSHRFPLHFFIQIENLARIAGVSVSVIINELIEVGLDALKKELPEDIVKQLPIASKEQLERPTVSESVEVKPRKAIALKSKGKSRKS